MTKISVTGPKTQLEKVVDELHRLGVMDIDDYEGELDTGEPMDGSEDISQLLVDIRSLLSKLESGESTKEEASISEVRGAASELSGEVKKFENQRERINREIDELKDKKSFYTKLEGLDIDFEQVNKSESLDFKILDFNADKFAKLVNTNHYEVFEGRIVPY